MFHKNYTCTRDITKLHKMDSHLFSGSEKDSVCTWRCRLSCMHIYSKKRFSAKWRKLSSANYDIQRWTKNIIEEAMMLTLAKMVFYKLAKRLKTKQRRIFLQTHFVLEECRIEIAIQYKTLKRFLRGDLKLF